MAATIFTKLQQKQYQEIVEAFNNKNTITVPTEDYIRMQDVLDILKERGVIIEIAADDVMFYRQSVEFSVFDKWQEDQAREAKKLSRREWKIAIFSAIIGALVGLLPTFIPWIKELFK